MSFEDKHFTIKNNRRVLSDETLNTIHKLYVLDEMSAKEVGLYFGEDASRIKTILSRMKIMRSQSEASKLACKKGKKNKAISILKEFAKTDAVRFHPNKTHTGKDNWHWKPIGTIKIENNYYKIKVGEYDWRYQHRVEAEAMLGRPLVKGECVHHIDFDKLNNAHSNLVVMDNKEHMKMHSTTEKIMSELIKKGIIKFTGKEYVYALEK